MTMTQLLLCGPQARLPSEHHSELRQCLLRRTSLCAALSSAARAVPALLRLLAAFDASLLRVPVASVDFLLQWVEHGSFSQPVDTLPNVVALPFAVLLQISLFLQHLDTDDDSNYSRTVQSLQQYGVQGFCTGFLTATAIAFSENEEQLAEYTVTSLRLAVCIGAYIDQNAPYAEPANPACTLSVRWPEGEFSTSQVEGLLAGYPHVRVKTSYFSAALLTTYF